MSKTLFSADHHFFHWTTHERNIIKYADRPYPNSLFGIDQMNRDMISKWNLKVKPGDIIWHLGDFSFKGRRHIKLICDMLNGYKILIKGNHDRHGKKFFLDVGFNEVYNKPIAYESKYFGSVILSHRPIKDKHILAGYNWNFHGHIHNYYKVKNKNINISVDVWNFEPVTEIDILREMVKTIW